MKNDTPTSPTERFQHPLYFTQRTLRYDRKDGRHVVVAYKGAGEDLYPQPYWFNTIEEARNQWRFLRAAWASEGYEALA